MAATTSTTFANQYQKYFSKKLLTYAVQELVLAQFGEKAPLPKKAGTKSVRWFKYGAPTSASVQTLTEGTPISAANYRVLSQSIVEEDLVQYGQVIQLTDVLTATEFFNSLAQATRTNGEDAALHMDTLIRNKLITGTNKRYSFTAGTTAQTFVGLSGGTADQGRFKAHDALDACTNLKLNRAPKISGGYVAVAPPQVTRDLMRDTDWLEASKYSAVQQLFKGEVGSFHGIRFIEATNPFIEDEVEGTFDSTDDNSDGLIYTTFVLGGEAFGVPELTGEGPFSPKVIITDQADKSDPLNQTINVGFKTFWASEILTNEYFVVHRSKTNYTLSA
jgi:N4-gp56 family major capsid protein